MQSLKLQSKRFVVTILAVLAFLAVPQASHAAYSWPDIVAMTYKQALEEAYDAFTNTMVANLKVQAAQLIRGRMQALLTGTNGKTLYITNYQQFIYGSSKSEGQVYASDFFNTLRSGVSPQVAKGLNKTEKGVKNEIFKGPEQSKITIDNYVKGGFDSVFDVSKGGGYAAFNNALNKNYFTSYIDGKNSTQKYMAMVQESNKVEATASKGYISNKDPKTNLIKTPGSLIADLTSFAESLPMRIVAYARSIPEVVGTMAAQTLSQTIQNGFSQVTQPIDNQLKNIHNTVSGGVSTVQGQVYSGIKFTNNKNLQKLPNYKSGQSSLSSQSTPASR